MLDTSDDALVRLVKLASDVLPSAKQVALVDGSHEGVSVVRVALILGPRSLVYPASPTAVYGG